MKSIRTSNNIDTKPLEIAHTENKDGTHSLAKPYILGPFKGGSEPVTLGGDAPGWVDGTIASLPISTAVVVRFDLGPDWRQYPLLQLNIKTTQAIVSAAAYASDDGTTNDAPLQAASGGAPFFGTAAGDMPVVVLAASRYVRVAVNNSTTIQGATAQVRLVAIP